MHCRENMSLNLGLVYRAPKACHITEGMWVWVLGLSLVKSPRYALPRGCGFRFRFRFRFSFKASMHREDVRFGFEFSYRNPKGIHYRRMWSLGLGFTGFCVVSFKLQNYIGRRGSLGFGFWLPEPQRHTFMRCGFGFWVWFTETPEALPRCRFCLGLEFGFVLP
jgi:hypothetical protein